MARGSSESLLRGIVLGALLGGVAFGWARLWKQDVPDVAAPPRASAPRLAVEASEPVRHPRLCGVRFANGEYRFDPSGSDGPGISVRHWAGAGRGPGDPLVMYFDEAADSVDLLARQGDPDAEGRAYLVGFDARGRVLDVDAGPISGGTPVTMQITALEPVIRAAQFYVDEREAPEGPARTGLIDEGQAARAWAIGSAGLGSRECCSRESSGYEPGTRSLGLIVGR